MVVRMKGRWKNGYYHNRLIMGIVHAHTYISSVFQHCFVRRIIEMGVSKFCMTVLSSDICVNILINCFHPLLLSLHGDFHINGNSLPLLSLSPHFGCCIFLDVLASSIKHTLLNKHDSLCLYVWWSSCSSSSLNPKITKRKPQIELLIWCQGYLHPTNGWARLWA